LHFVHWYFFAALFQPLRLDLEKIITLSTKNIIESKKASTNMFSHEPLLDLWLDRLAIYYKEKKT